MLINCFKSLAVKCLLNLFDCGTMLPRATPFSILRNQFVEERTLGNVDWVLLSLAKFSFFGSFCRQRLYFVYLSFLSFGQLGGRDHVVGFEKGGVQEKCFSLEPCQEELSFQWGGAPFSERRVPRALIAEILSSFFFFFSFLFSAGMGPRERPEDSPAVPVWSGCLGSYCVVLRRAGSHVKS